MRRGKGSSGVRPFKLAFVTADGRRLSMRPYKTEFAARTQAARLLSEFYTGRQGGSQPVATITGPSGTIRLTKTRALYVEELS